MNSIVSKFSGDTALAALHQSQSEEASIPILRQYLGMAMRWRYVILGAVAVCFLIGLVVTLLMTPQYTASSTIEISRESDKVTDLQGVERDASISDQEFYQTQYGLLQSRSLSERVAAELKLIDSPGFFEMFDAVKDTPTFKLTNGRYSATSHAARQRIAGEILRSNLNINPARMSRLVEIHFTSPDPAFSAKVANVWAQNFIQTNLDRKIQATSYGRNLLEGQLAQLKQKLDASQRQRIG